MVWKKVLGYIGIIAFCLGFDTHEKNVWGDFFGGAASSVSDRSKVVRRINLHDIDNRLIDIIKREISPKTQIELSGLIMQNPTNNAEAGGAFYLTEDRIIFYPLANANLMAIGEIEDMKIAAINGVRRLGAEDYDHLATIVENNFPGDCDCNPKDIDNGWTDWRDNLLEQIKEAKGFIGTSGDDIYAERVIDNIVKYLGDSYRAVDLEISPKGVYLGGVHTHDDMTGFSSIDLCLSKRRPGFLVTHNFPEENFFRLYLGGRGEEFFIGEYSVKADECKN